MQIHFGNLKSHNKTANVLAQLVFFEPSRTDECQNQCSKWLFTAAK